MMQKTNNKQLIDAAHLAAKYLPLASAQLMVELANRLSHETQSSAITDIIAERQRQQSVEGWTQESDDKYLPGELSIAAACYAARAFSKPVYKVTVPQAWPWNTKWWKPTTERRDLVKAAALITAEIERIDRAEGKAEPQPAIKPLPVERDKYGYWTHPVYSDFCDGRESISSEEFNAWMTANGLDWEVVYRDEDDIDPGVDGYDISQWTPESPEGEGWFVGSIHDTEDGAVCIWLREGKAGEVVGE